MRLKPFICAFVAGCWALAYSYPVAAQEAREWNTQFDEAPDSRNDPDPILSESESRSNNKLPVGGGAQKEIQRDSVQTKTVKPIKTLEKAEKQADPLSFNFLYYIIEKYKLSDIIE